MAVAPELPRRTAPLPYGRQWIDDDDIAAVVEVLRSDWLTTGPKVEEFEAAFAAQTGASEAVAVSSGTAALHLAIAALDLGPGDEVIVPSLTFAASANCVVYCGATPVFADVDPATLLLDVADAERRITPRTRAIVAVDYAGQPCDYDALRTLADLSCFSLHPVKHITTGEGGVVTTDDAALAARLRRLRNHGIDTDHRLRAETGAWFYEVTELGFNYRLTDFQCALGLSQLGKLDSWIDTRRRLAAAYDDAFAAVDHVTPVTLRTDASHAYHLYVVQVANRDAVFAGLRARGIGANVHYVPVHLHPFYRERFGTGPGQCPVAESAYARILSLPLFPQMTADDAAFVVAALRAEVSA